MDNAIKENCLKNELKIISYLRNDESKFIGEYFIDMDDEKSIYMPLYQLNLDKMIKKQTTYEVNLSLENKLFILKGIVQGIGFLRSKNVLHRDLKPANIMLSKDLIPKLIDFGSGSLAYPSRQDIITARKIFFNLVFST